MATDDQTPEANTAGDGAASVADEAARLAQAFSVWAQNGRGAATSRTDPDEPGAGVAAGCGCTHGDAVEAVCRMCPVCRAAGILQAVQPELLDRVADLLSMLAGGLRTAAEDRRAGDSDGNASPDDAE